MSVERNLLMALLKLTNGKSASVEDVKNTARLPISSCQFLLAKMLNENLVYLKNNNVEVDSQNRVRIAVKAASLGGDIQAISDLLCWQEFEEIAAIALRTNGYHVHKNVRFKQGNRRYEIDVVGCRKPIVICIDCKRWQKTISASALRKIVDEQTQRVQALGAAIPNPKIKLECAKWENATFIPAVLSLIPSSYKFYYDVPVVPVLKLQDFISQMLLHLESVKSYPIQFKKLG
jgi:Holliday junction resolvase-like predicted endonuclease